MPGFSVSVNGILSRAAWSKLHIDMAGPFTLQLMRQGRLDQPMYGVFRRWMSSLPPHTFLDMPALPPTTSEGDLTKWHVKPGDDVTPGMVIADVETDNASLAFEIQQEGFVAKLLVPNGTRDVPIGKPVAVLVEDAESVGTFANYAERVMASTSVAAVASPAAAPSSTAAAKTYPPHVRLTMPSLSPTMDRGNLLAWKVAPGDALRPGDVLADIETDKAVLCWENVAEEGFVARLLVPAGARDVAVGSPLAIVVEDRDSVAAFADYGAAAEGGRSFPSSSTVGVEDAKKKEAPKVVASDRLGPAARLLLAAAGLSREDVVPSGPRNIITKADVLAAIAAGVKPSSSSGGDAATSTAAAPPPPHPPTPATTVSKSAAPAAAAVRPQPHTTAPSDPPSPQPSMPPRAAAAPASSPSSSQQQHPSPQQLSRFTDIPNSQVRRVIAARLLESKRTAPSLYLAGEACGDALGELRAALAARGTKVSVNDCVLRAVALALRDVPAANAYWDGGAGEVRRHASVNLAVAVASPRGLVTPVLQGVADKGLRELSGELRGLVRRAVVGKLKPEEFTGGSFTVSHLGMYGTSYFSAIINPPQAGILAIGASEERVVLRGGSPAVAPMMRVTLSADARVYDGEVAAAFLAAFRGHVEAPYELVPLNGVP